MEFRFGELSEFAPGAIWFVDYPVRYFGLDIAARMIVVRLSDGRLMLLSPCEITAALKSAIEAIGPVGWIVAPGTFHYLHLPSAQAAFPDAETWICPGLEEKRPELPYDGILGDRPEPGWAADLDQVPVTGGRVMAEVVFFHPASATLIVTDLIELVGRMTPGVGPMLRFWWAIFRMWNKPRPAPEYRMGWRDRAGAAAALRKVLNWDFRRILLQHGANIETDAHAAAEQAWAAILRHG